MATCTNTRGSFTCECNEGWQGDGRDCADDNQCYNGETGCHINAEVGSQSHIVLTLKLAQIGVQHISM